MNSKFIAATVIALSSLGATAAFADTFEVITPNTTSNTTRAAVLAESAKARSVVVAGSQDTSQQIRWSTKTNTTRAAVLAELAKAKADGTLEVANNIGEFTTVSGRPVSAQTLAQVTK